jgi:hypothetical protein
MTGAGVKGNLEAPELALVVLVGISGSGKSTFAGRHFAPGRPLTWHSDCAPNVCAVRLSHPLRAR